MNNLFEISSKEKNRILNLHEGATKRQYLTLEQVGQQTGPGMSTKTTVTPTTFLTQKLNNQFKFGEYQSDAAKNSIAALKPKIEEFIKNSGGKQFVVNISAGESNVTNPKGFETKGSLALARANSVKQYFQELFPDLIKNGTLVIRTPKDVSDIVLGKTPYDKTKNDNKNPQLIKLYNQEQFVNFDIQGSGQISNVKSICNWKATLTGGTGNASKNFVTTDEDLSGKGVLTFGTGRIPDRLVVLSKNGDVIQDTGYVATGALTKPYPEFKFVPIYVSQLTKVNQTVSVSGNKIVKINANNYEELLKQLLVNPNNYITYVRTLTNLPREVKEGLLALKQLCNSGVKEFVLYTIVQPETITIPFDTAQGASKVVVYSPIGTTGYSLTGSC
jgi:hypothetical protein